MSRRAAAGPRRRSGAQGGAASAAWLVCTCCLGTRATSPMTPAQQLQHDFAALCSQSAVIRNGYGCGFSFTAYHPAATNATTLRTVCPQLTAAECSPLLLSMSAPPCPPGTFDSSATIRSRAYSGQSGASPCVPCAAGKRDSDGDALTPCVPCRIGRYSVGQALLCFACEAGKRAATPIAEPPRPADPHAQADVGGSAACEACAPGRYSAAESTACAPCGVGTHDHDGSAATPCTTCRAGTFSPAPNSCVGCPAGRYSDRPAAASCLPCPTRQPNHSSFLGSFTAGNESMCHACPEGTADSDHDPATPCCPDLCRAGCAYAAAASVRTATALTYPADCAAFVVSKRATSTGTRPRYPAVLMRVLALATLFGRLNT
eukprot:COSAG01_NODE_6765_length_3508_cov_3.160117_2_plen_375_part_00